VVGGAAVGAEVVELTKTVVARHCAKLAGARTASLSFTTYHPYPVYADKPRIYIIFTVACEWTWECIKISYGWHKRKSCKTKHI
jgi:hypothetical protein